MKLPRLDCGVVEEGRYRIEGDRIVLVDINGKQGGDPKGKLIQITPQCCRSSGIAKSVFQVHGVGGEADIAIRAARVQEPFGQFTP